jgi:hypothetical protein
MNTEDNIRVSERLSNERVVKPNNELRVDVERKSIVERLSINTSNPLEITWLDSLHTIHTAFKRHVKKMKFEVKLL